MECKNTISCDLEDADMIGIQILHAYEYAYKRSVNKNKTYKSQNKKRP